MIFFRLTIALHALGKLKTDHPMLIQIQELLHKIIQTKRKLFLCGFLDMLVFEETRLLIELRKKLLTADLMPFSDLKPFTAKYVYQIWQKEWDETVLVSNKFHEILWKLPDKLLSFRNTRKENTVLNKLHIGHSYLTHSFILREEEAPVCVACNAVITV